MADAAIRPGAVHLAPARRAPLGRSLLVRAQTESTNDDAWDALGRGLARMGVTVVADAQLRGPRPRGPRVDARAGAADSRSRWRCAWAATCGRPGLLPLVAGLALAEAVRQFGVAPRLKWPNDVLVDGRKIAGVLCELRRLARGR